MKQYRFKIKYDGKFSYSWGYALYSAFLEEIGKEKANEIHEDEYFNQYLTQEEWVVNSKNDLQFAEEYDLHKFATKIQLLDCRETECIEQNMADKFLIYDPYVRRIRVRFLTPTTFKQQGAYVLYPTSDLIMQSLSRKWNRWAEEFGLEDLEWDKCRIDKYNLKSAPYYLKETKINGFVGQVDLIFWGSESMIRLANMICYFGNYSGIGIKTALGMGGIKVE